MKGQVCESADPLCNFPLACTVHSYTGHSGLITAVAVVAPVAPGS